MRVVQNFDIQSIIEVSLMEKSSSMFQKRVYVSISPIDFSIDQRRLGDLLSFYYKFTGNQAKINDTIQKFTYQTRETIQQLQLDTNETNVGDKQLTNQSILSQDDLIDVDSDDEFFDALDDNDKQFYNLVKNTSTTAHAQAPSMYHELSDKDMRLQEHQEDANFQNKLFVLANLQRIRFSILESSRSSPLRSVDESKEEIEMKS